MTAEGDIPGVVEQYITASGQGKVYALGQGMQLNIGSLTFGGNPNPEHGVEALDPRLDLLPVVRGRDAVLGELETALDTRPDRTYVLHGLGGCGKSTVALALARVATDRGFEVFWVRPSGLTASMIEVAYRLGADPVSLEMARTDRINAPDLAWATLGASQRPWLLVFDDFDEPPEANWIRHSPRGLTIVTSRNGDQELWGDPARLYRLGVLDSGSGAQMLLDIAPHAGSGDDARALAERLGNLPLALRLAGRCLAAEPLWLRTFQSYGLALDEDFTDVIDRLARTPRDAVLQTWEISLRQLERDGIPEARPVLQLLSCLSARDPVLLTLLDPELLSVLLRPPTADRLSQGRTEKILRAMTILSLIDISDTTVTEQEPVASIVVHPLVAEVAAASLTAENAPLVWATAVLGALKASFADPQSPADWLQWQLFYPHCREILARLPPGHDLLPEMLMVSSRTVSYAHRAGRYADELEMAELCLRRSQELPVEHPEALEARAVYASALITAGELDAAENEFHEIYLVQRRIFGMTDRRVITTWANLAEIYQRRGWYVVAEAEMRGIARASQQAGSLDRTTTFIMRNDFAAVLAQRSKFAEAADELQSIIQLGQTEPGEGHPVILAARFNSALLRAEGGDFEAAERELRVAIASEDRWLGADHPQTLGSIVALARIIWLRGDSAKAQRLYEEALARSERALGRDHAKTRKLRLASPAEVSWPRLSVTSAGEPETAAQSPDEEAYVTGASLEADDPGGAAECYLRAAQSRHLLAMIAIGRLREADGNTDGAIGWYRVAAEEGSGAAMFRLACLLDGPDEARDASQWYQRAAEAGHPAAAYEMGRRRENSGDPVGAVGWYETAAKAADLDGMIALARLYQAAGRDRQAREWYLAGAQAGSAEAAYRLAIMLEKSGEGGAAERWYATAAEAAHPLALRHLGQYVKAAQRSCDLAIRRARRDEFEAAREYYSIGTEIEGMLKKKERAGLSQPIAEVAHQIGLLCTRSGDLGGAIEWETVAAERGHTEAIERLGDAYREADAPDSAEKWYLTGAAAGSLWSMHCLGVLREAAGDNDHAFGWYQKAADAGYIPSAASLGVLYEAAGDLESAVRWFEIAAAGDHALAMVGLARHYAQTGDMTAAAEWTGKAADGLYRTAMAAEREGDLSEARKFHRIAAGLGESRSERRLEILLPRQVGHSHPACGRTTSPLWPQWSHRTGLAR